MDSSTIFQAQIDPRNPLIAGWLLRQLECARKAGRPDKAGSILALFDDLTVRQLLDSSDEYLLLHLLDELPVERFLNSLGFLQSKWNNWPSLLARRSTALMANIDPSRAADFFADYLARPPVAFERFYAITEALPLLPDGAADKLGETIITAFLDHMKDDEIAHMMTSDIVRLAMKLNHSRLDEVLELVLLTVEKADERAVANRITAVAQALTGSSLECELLCDRVLGETSQPFAELAPYFREGAPLAELDHQADLLNPDDVAPATSFYYAHRESLPGSLRNVLDRLLNLMLDCAALNASETGYLCYTLFPASIMASLRREAPLLHDLDFASAVRLLACDIDRIPYLDDIAESFRVQDRQTVVATLRNMLFETADHFGGVNIAYVMGRLGFEEFVAPLFKQLASDNYRLCEESKEALILIGEPSVVQILSNLDTLPSECHYYAYSALEEVGGPRVAEFVADNFRKLLRFDKEVAMNLVLAAPEQRLIPLLAPHAGKGQELVDEAYLVLCALHGVTSSEIESLGIANAQQRAAEAERRRQMDRGDFAAGITPTLALEMKCSACGDKSRYEVTRVVVNVATGTPFVCDELACVGCGAGETLKIAPASLLAVSGEVMRAGLIEDPDERARALARSAVEMVPGITVKGKDLEIEEGYRSLP